MREKIAFTFACKKPLPRPIPGAVQTTVRYDRADQPGPARDLRRCRLPCWRRPATFLTVTEGVEPCPCRYPSSLALSGLVGSREWVFPVPQTGRLRWLSTLPTGRHRIGEYMHLQQCTPGTLAP